MKINWIIAAVLLTLPSALYAEESKKPLYELGIGSAYFWTANYPAADQSQWNGLAVPYFAYRGKYFRSDREDGVRTMFSESKKWELDLSLSAAFPSSASDNKAREGMNDLSWIGEAGPQVSYYFIRERTHLLRLQVPYRFAVSTDFRTWVDRGEVFQPVMRYSFRHWFDRKLVVGLRLGGWWGSRRMNEYFYEVEPRFVRVDRPQYGAHSGYIGRFQSLSLLYMATSKLWLFAGLSYTDYRGSANEDSPLYRSKQNQGCGGGIIWSFYESKERERRRTKEFSP